MVYSTLVSAQQLAENLDNRHWLVFDCRFSLADYQAGEKSYRQGHIPGAIYVNLNQHLSSPVQSYTGRHPLPDFKQLTQLLSSWGVNQHSQIVVYDDAGGAFAGRFWWLLRTMGHEQVAVLDGGIKHWQKQALPITTTLPKPQASQFRCYLDNSHWLTASQVEDSLAKGSIRLIDARAAERYQGLSEPIDRIAGHIPKAINRPFSLNLNSKGLFVSPEQLAKQFKAIIGNRPVNQIVHMCGSGVTACHNLLAMEIAGLTGSKLYAGSWSDWIVDNNRAVARGVD